MYYIWVARFEQKGEKEEKEEKNKIFRIIMCVCFF